jgi:hypothetical protein
MNGVMQTHFMPSKCSHRKVVLIMSMVVMPFSIVCSAVDAAFFTQRFVPRLSIELDEVAVKSLQRSPRVYVPAAIRADTSVWRRVGVRLKGNGGSFRSIDDRPCLTLKFDHSVAEQRFYDLTKIHLNNSVQDPTALNESIASEMFRAAGVPAARSSHAIVTLNGRNLGLYVLVEGFDKQFLEQHFSNPTGNLYDGGSMNDVNQALVLKRGEGLSGGIDLSNLVAATTEVIESRRLEKLGSELELDRFCSFLAVETMACAWDGYATHHNNYWLYRNPATGGFVFLPHGSDQIFGQPQTALLPDCGGLVAWAFLTTPTGREMFRRRSTELLTNAFTIERLNEVIDQAEGKLRPALAQLGVATLREHETAVQLLRERIAQRVDHLKKELLGPAAPALVFDETGETKLSGWLPQINHGRADLTTTNQTLQIRCLGTHLPTITSWRRHGVLPRGRYRLEGKVHAENLRPIPQTPVVSMGLYGGATDSSVAAPGTSGTRTLKADFTVTEPLEPVDFVCEIRAFSGVVSFEDLKLIRLAQVDGDRKE